MNGFTNAYTNSLSYGLLCLGRRANQVAAMVFHKPPVDLTEPSIQRSCRFGDTTPVNARCSQRDLVSA